MSYTDVFGNTTLPPAEYGYRSQTLTGDVTLEWPYNTNVTTSTVAKIMDISCAAGNVITLPDATLVSTGEDFLIRNVGANPLTVKRSDGVLVYTVAAGAAVYFYLTDNSTTAGVFGTVPYGVGSSYVDAAVLVGYGIKAISGTLNQAHPVTTNSASVTIDETYRAKLLNFNGGAATISLASVSTLGDDFFFLLRNSGTGTLTIDPNGSQTIDGQTTLQIQPGESLMLFCSGAAWYSVGYGRSTLYQFTQLVKDVTSGGPFTLTSSEASNKLITFIGTPSATVTVNVPAVVSVYYLYNNCSTPQAVTFKTSAGTGVSVSQTGRAIVLCDGTNVIAAQSVSVSSSISLIDGTNSAPSLNFASQTNTGLYKYGSQGLGASANGTNVLQLEPTRALITVPQDYASYSTSAGAPSYAEGRVFYDAADHTLAYYNDAAGMTVNIGQEQIVRVRNITGSTLTDGQVVYINGAAGNRPTVALAKADAEATSAGTIGVVTDAIANNADGYITVSGLVHGLNTASYTEGDAVYLSPSTAGAFTHTKPSAPNHMVLVGYVTRAHATQGTIFVKVDNGYELDELHNVLITTPSNNQALVYDSATSLWKNQTLSNYGDVSSNTSSSVDSELALFSGTGGKTIKRATTTGILKATSGVISAATSGTDYVAPSTLSSYLPLAGGSMTGALNEAAAVTLASGATLDIGTANSNTINVTGTTTITSLGTAAAGVRRRLVFAGALTLTHNATSLILPGAANIATAAGDVAEMLSLGSGNWKCVTYQKADGAAIKGGGNPSITRIYDQGRQWQANYSRQATKSGTYSQSGTTITVTSTAHGLATGDWVYLDFTTGTATDSWFGVTVTGANSFTVTTGASATTSGNVTINMPVIVTLAGVQAGITPSLSDGMLIGLRATSGAMGGLETTQGVAAQVRNPVGSTFQISGIFPTSAPAGTTGNAVVAGLGAAATWTKPAGLVSIDVIVLAGGGQGAGCAANSSGNGAASGSVAIKNINASILGATESITIGMGGGNVNFTGVAQNGGTSSFGAHCSAAGGLSGKNLSMASTPAKATGGDLNIDGWLPPWFLGVSDGKSGAGSHFGPPTHFQSASASRAGDSAFTPGGGGVGSIDNGSTQYSGGFGGMGFVIVKENY